jgi:hypothetical protein
VYSKSWLISKSFGAAGGEEVPCSYLIMQVRAQENLKGVRSGGDYRTCMGGRLERRAMVGTGWTREMEFDFGCAGVLPSVE